MTDGEVERGADVAVVDGVGAPDDAFCRCHTFSKCMRAAVVSLVKSQACCKVWPYHAAMWWGLATHCCHWAGACCHQRVTACERWAIMVVTASFQAWVHVRWVSVPAIICCIHWA